MTGGGLSYSTDFSKPTCHTPIFTHSCIHWWQRLSSNLANPWCFHARPLGHSHTDSHQEQFVQYLAWGYLNVQPEDQRIEPPTFWSVNNPLYLLSHSCHKYDSCGDKCGKNKKCSNTKRQSCSPETCVHLNKIQFSALHLEFCPVLDENENLFLFGRWSMTFLLGSEGEGKFKKITVFNSEKCQNIVEIPIFPGPRYKDSLITYIIVAAVS